MKNTGDNLAAAELAATKLINILLNKIHPVEDRQKKNGQFKAFLAEILKRTLNSPAIKSIGNFSFEILDTVNITEEFGELVDHEGSSGKISSEDKVYCSLLNGEKLFLFTNKWFDDLLLINHDEQYDLAYLHDLKYFALVFGNSFEKAFIRASCSQNQDYRKMILSNKKTVFFTGQNHEYLKSDDMNQLGYYARFNIRSKISHSDNPFQIWISGKLMEQINLKPLNILKLNNLPDFIFDMTPEEYEQFQKESAERIEKIEKKALERLTDPRRGTLRDYIES